MRFRDLQIGQVFVFTEEDAPDYSGSTRGPWVKTTAGRYRHAHPEHRIPFEGYIVGDTRAKVRVIEED